MKKIYNAPTTEVMKIKAESLLVESITETNLDDLSIDVAEPGDVGRGRYVNKLWLDDDE